MKVAAAPVESVALLMNDVLKDAGIPLLIRRAPDFDAPDFLAAGPRDVMVPGSLCSVHPGHEAARCTRGHASEGGRPPQDRAGVWSARLWVATGE